MNKLQLNNTLSDIDANLHYIKGEIAEKFEKLTDSEQLNIYHPRNILL